MSASAPTIRVADLASEAECARIDAFVATQAAGTPFHRTGWLKAGAAGCGQTAHCLLAEGQGGAIVGMLPLSEIRSPLFGAAMVSTGFGVDGGVLGEGVDALADAAWALAGEKGIESVELRGGPVPDGWTADADSYLGFVRPIAGDDEAEMKAIPRKQRAELRKALAQDLEVVTGRDPRMLAEHYRVYAESVRNLGTPVFPARLFREAVARLDADVLTVRHEGRAVASVLNLIAAAAQDRRTLFAEWSQLGSVLSVVIPTAVYVLAIPFVGIYVSSIALIAIFMKWLGRYSLAVSIIVSVAVMLGVFLMFEKWFLVPLPKGPIEEWLGF